MNAKRKSHKHRKRVHKPNETHTDIQGEPNENHTRRRNPHTHQTEILQKLKKHYETRIQTPIGNHTYIKGNQTNIIQTSYRNQGNQTKTIPTQKIIQTPKRPYRNQRETKRTSYKRQNENHTETKVSQTSIIQQPDANPTDTNESETDIIQTYGTSYKSEAKIIQA